MKACELNVHKTLNDAAVKLELPGDGYSERADVLSIKLSTVTAEMAFFDIF
jgi:hypothetical protein